jgi:hypothetical protein
MQGPLHSLRKHNTYRRGTLSIQPALSTSTNVFQHCDVVWASTAWLSRYGGRHSTEAPPENVQVKPNHEEAVILQKMGLLSMSQYFNRQHQPMWNYTWLNPPRVERAFNPQGSGGRLSSRQLIRQQAKWNQRANPRQSAPRRPDLASLPAAIQAPECHKLPQSRHTSSHCSLDMVASQALKLLMSLALRIVQVVTSVMTEPKIAISMNLWAIVQSPEPQIDSGTQTLLEHTCPI